MMGILSHTIDFVIGGHGKLPASSPSTLGNLSAGKQKASNARTNTIQFHKNRRKYRAETPVD